MNDEWASKGIAAIKAKVKKDQRTRKIKIKRREKREKKE